ncbi:histidine kinase dimerization/phospho-acceptor domain-containing protein [Thermosynechococcaceae cyanobacterium BACA0444]|uniref:histidine kinase n=1 Tax=Pseudocalidococcus azoricus BACA0444 TaxID=2918990 RepID=A0AAE4FSJ4_9CYAN|nr:histidine kinase dimerization/phospho-acceptor domain-containing protein [Pseudocalidococcus azoricus]MDS3861331.1 histidine kinase dimerization/phospho-acceptor domain-containing protein [Pseudocalidococcus azoricus BACA0444]
MTRITLGAFLKLVPTYRASMGVADWLGHWSADQTREGAVMLLDHLGCPQAVVNGWAIAAQVQVDPKLKSKTLDCEQFQAWALPMITVRADLAVEEWLETPTLPDLVALVGLNGQYLGLLDLGALVRYCLFAEVSWQGGDGSEIPPELLRAWEALAWPVLIQTGEGEAIWQNSAWQTQLGPGGIALNVDRQGSRPGLNLNATYGSRWQFYPLPLSSHHGILASTHILKTQPELLPALCLTGLGQSLVNSLEIATAASVTLWLVLGLEIPHLEPWTEELNANLTALRQRYQYQQKFLSALNHELKNPVTSLLSLTQLLLQSDPEHGELRQQDCLALMERASRQLSFLLNQWLELTEAAQGNVDLTWEPLALRLLVHQAQEWLIQQLPSFGGGLTAAELGQRFEHFHIEIPPGLTHLSGDRLRLRQSCGYLLMVLAGLGQGNLDSPQGEDWGCRVKQWPGWQELQFWQTGRGIPITEQCHLLDAMPEAGTSGAGVGLGIILSRQFIRLHGGELSFWAKDGAAGAGLEFSLLFPVNLEHQGQLILLYGHDPAWLRQLSDYWAGLGYATAIARQDLELLDKSRQLRPQAIVLEPQLYQSGGQHLFLASLRNLLTAMAETAKIPLISWSQGSVPEPHPGVYLLTEPEDLSGLAALINQLATVKFPSSSPPLTPVKSLPVKTSAPTTVLTVLRLGATHAFTPQLHRFLEATDLEQGQLLAEIWQPDILLWDLPLPTGLNELTTLPDYPLLSRLPLVTLDEQITRQAYQIPGVAVYPCLDVALLGQVIERAWRHSII